MALSTLSILLIRLPKSTREQTEVPNLAPKTLLMLAGRHKNEAPRQKVFSKIHVKKIGVIPTQ